MKTKDKILEFALKLFNEQGTKMVSTNHIAEAGGMSPGNLYYHYKNKGEIIRVIFSKMVTEFDNADCFFEKKSLCIEQMGNHVQKILEIQWKYRFIQSEMMTLVDYDFWLKEQMIEVNRKRQEKFKNFICQMIELDQMIAIPDETILFLVRNSWIISIFWQPYLNLNGEKVTKEKLNEGMQQIFFLFHPYLKNPQALKAQLD